MDRRRWSGRAGRFGLRALRTVAAAATRALLLLLLSVCPELAAPPVSVSEALEGGETSVEEFARPRARRVTRVVRGASGPAPQPSPVVIAPRPQPAPRPLGRPATPAPRKLPPAVTDAPSAPDAD